MTRGEQPAYPVPRDTWVEDYPCGITVREHFAGLAMQGLLTGGQFSVASAQERELFAQFAVQQADALIAALGGKS